MDANIIGILLGFGARLFPEVLRFFDRRDERKHEAIMQDKAREYQESIGQSKVAEIGAEDTAQAIDAITKAWENQAEPAKTWIDKWNKLIRPLMATCWVLTLWPLVILIELYLLYVTNNLHSINQVFGETEKGFASSIASFWILNRIYMRK